MSRVDALVQQLALSPHPEGGFYREWYRAEATLPGTTRPVSTAIHYLLPHGHCSTLHRIDADELWHFYEGDALEVVELVAGAPARVTRLCAATPTHLVKAGVWFGARIPEGAVFGLVGCTVSPGFDFAHFELGTREALSKAFPEARSVVEQLTTLRQLG